MPNPKFLLPLLAALLLLPTPVAADDAAPAPFAELEQLRAGEPIVAGDVLLVPILRPAAMVDVQVTPARTAAKLRIQERAQAVTPHALDAANGGDVPVLLPAGSLLEGGTVDRLTLRTVIAAPGQTVRLPVTPAATSPRAKPVADGVLEPAPVHAPQFVRATARDKAHPRHVEAFMKRVGALLPDDVEMPTSLIALAQAKSLQRHCVSCAKPVAIEDKRVVGVATFVRGHFHALDLFGSKALYAAYEKPLLRSHAFRLMALDKRARVLGVPMYADAPKAERTKRAKVLTGAALKALATPKSWKALPEIDGTLGTSYGLETAHGHARVLVAKERLVHVALFPRDPYGPKLFAAPEASAEESEADAGVRELERRRDGEGRRLTEEEKRRLERLERRRAGQLRQSVRIRR